MTWNCPECGKEFEEGRRWAIYQHKYETHNLESGEEYIERYQRIKSEIPEKYRSIYEQLTGHGKRAPHSIQAAVYYIEFEINQETAAETFGVSIQTVRNAVEDLVDRGVISLEYVQENCVKDGYGQFGKCTNKNRNWKPKQ